MLKGVTISGKVRFCAMLLGTPTWSILRLGSGVMTVLAEKSTLIVVVGLQDVGELVGEIVMVPGLAEHDHGRADTERRDGQSRHQHLHRHKLGVHPQDVALLVRDVTEGRADSLGRIFFS